MDDVNRLFDLAAQRHITCLHMSLLISSLAKAFGQISDPVIIRLAAKSIAITLGLFAIAGVGVYFALDHLIAAFEWAGDGWLALVASAIITIIAFWFLFRVVALAVLQFFADEIVASVEARYYPDRSEKARALPLAQDVANSLRGIARALGFNLLALPFAAILFFTAIGPAIVFLLVNAILLGRELTDMAWLRHCDSQPSNNPVPAMERFALGTIIAVMMLVPFINLIAPVIGAAAGAHLLHNRMHETGTHNAA